jgi:enoyl-CoA hydratase
MTKWLRSTNFLTFEIQNGVAWVTLNRPAKRNALSRDLLRELREALLEADDRKAVHCVVLQGAGQDFCAGYDLAPRDAGGDGFDPAEYRQGAANVDDDIWRLERNQADLLTVFDMHKPVIAAVHGHCVAGGTDLALACDMVIAAHTARIGFPAVRSQGTPPNHLWLYNVGPQWAKRMLLTGDMLSGKDAAKIGLVLKSVPADKLQAEVRGLAERMALIDPDVLAANKRVVNMGMEMMGARTLQRYSAETDARAHQAASARGFNQAAREHGLTQAFRLRDAPFGNPMVDLGED